MKTILLIAVMAGFLTTGNVYAQTVDCLQPHVAGTCPGDNLHTTFLLAPVNDEAACVTYKKGNAVIAACPGTPDISGNTDYKIAGTYMGNYPLVCTSYKHDDGTVVVNCHPRCVLMDDPLTGREWYDCPGN